MTGLTRGELARRANTKTSTVRFYEARGLLAAVATGENGYHYFRPADVQRLRFIQRGQELGFTLEEIAELLALRTEPGTTCADIRARADGKIIQVEAKIQDLRRIRKALLALRQSCIGRGPVGECPILDALESDSRSRSTTHLKKGEKR